MLENPEKKWQTLSLLSKYIMKYNELAIKVNIIRNCEINYNLSNISTMCYFDWISGYGKEE
jgi:hypothetical protein